MKRKQKEKVKILLVQIMNRNFGDAVIAENTLFLLRRALHRRNNDYEILKYNILTKDIAQVKYVDAIIFAGGGIIKYEHEDFWSLIHDLICEAQKWDVPVFLNAVGVEGYSDDDTRCRVLKEAINLNCVKGISVRDDMDILKKHYITNKGIRIRPVFDSAIYSPYTYMIKKDTHSNIIGVGIAREMLVSDFGHDKINRDYLVNFYRQLVKNIETLGYEWVIFTNGSLKDNEFAQEVLSEIGYGGSVITPRSDKELVSTIATFKGIIASRMHANIIAYALNIPGIGLVWNSKLMFLGKKIGCLVITFIYPSWSSLVNNAASDVSKRISSPDSKGFHDNEIVKYIKEHTDEEDVISVLGNQCRFYLYSNRLPNSKYIFLPDPRVDSSITKEYFEELRNTPPEIIVISTKYTGVRAYVSDEMDAFLEEYRYELVLDGDTPVYQQSRVME